MSMVNDGLCSCHLMFYSLRIERKEQKAKCAALLSRMEVGRCRHPTGAMRSSFSIVLAEITGASTDHADDLLVG
jgi:hypothetical protein